MNENLSVLPKEHQAALYRALHDPLDPLSPCWNRQGAWIMSGTRRLSS